MFYHEVVPLNYIGDDISSLTYSANEKIKIGTTVKIPLRNKVVLGIVISSAKKPDYVTKEIIGVVDNAPILNEKYLSLAKWLGDYYASSLSKVFSSMVPKTITWKRRQQNNEQIIDSNIISSKLELTPDQKKVLDDILAASENKPHLIFGVTGSGKTEIYLRLIEDALARGEDIIYLVPEVSLIPQNEAILKARFKNNVLVLHSYLKETERFTNWETIARNRGNIVIGTRSALFAPCTSLGLIIIDEEHETSYKQDQSPRYHARTLAEKLAILTGAKLVLGSATPSVESYYKAKACEYYLHRLDKRIVQENLPKVVVVDMRDEFKKKNFSIFSDVLQHEIKESLAEKKQILLFLNRRGMSTFVSCRTCGYVALCPNCDISLTFHYHDLSLVCHHCAHNETIPTSCPNCGSLAIKYFGSGTQRVEQELKKTFGDKIKIGRMDKDTTKTRGSHQVLYNSFAQNKTDILIGTQMVSKGWDLPNVGLVGIISADTMINFPDFSAPERTFDLLTQVAGRTGRGEEPGKVVLQTYSPDHYAIDSAARHDFIKFYNAELIYRQDLVYPPFCRLIKLMLRKNDQAQAERQATDLAEKIKNNFKNIHVLGPSPSFLPKVGGKYRWQLILKITGNDKENTVKIVGEINKLMDKDWSIDVDPITTL